MEGLLLVATLFLTAVILMLGITFSFLVYKLFKMEFEIPFIQKDEKTDKFEEAGDLFTRTPNRIPIEQFIPRGDKPMTIKYSDKDEFKKE